MYVGKTSDIYISAEQIAQAMRETNHTRGSLMEKLQIKPRSFDRHLAEGVAHSVKDVYKKRWKEFIKQASLDFDPEVKRERELNASRQKLHEITGDLTFDQVEKLVLSAKKMQHENIVLSDPSRSMQLLIQKRAVDEEFLQELLNAIPQRDEPPQADERSNGKAKG